MSAHSPDSLVQDRPLAEAIVAATRPLHNALNKLILARLPLALPPCAADPTLYLTGLLHIAPIYIAFEELWRDIVELRLDALNRNIPVNSLHQDAQPLVSDRVRSVLAALYVPGLVRSDRMRADIASLTGWSPQVFEELLRSASRIGHLAAFVDHIRRVVSHKPHVLVAYTYILFMALFVGGRFLRTTLESAGLPFCDSRSDLIHPSSAVPEHGAAPSAPTEYHVHHHRQHRHNHDHEGTRDETLAFGAELSSLPSMPLRFLHFNTPADGEDLKREYKQKLSESEASLTHGEKKDIVQEGLCIFENMNSLVYQLDTVCAAQDPGAAARLHCSWSLVGLVKNAHVAGDRLRDSIAVTRQRWERSSAKEPRTEDDGPESDLAKASMERSGTPDPCPRPSP